jgi:hypothetical protein
MNLFCKSFFGVNVFAANLYIVNLFLYSSKVLSRNRKEQAEAGRSPALLALCFAAGVFRILRGYFEWFFTAKQKKTGYLAVSLITI